MFDAIQADTVAYLSSLATTGDLLEGIKSVRGGDAPVPTTDHPAITVDWDEDHEHSYDGNNSSFSFNFSVTLYVISMEAEATAEQILQRHLLRYDTNTDSFAGLLVALHRRRGWNSESQPGLCFRQSVYPEIRTGVVKDSRLKCYTTAAVVRFRATAEVLASNL